VPRRHLTDIESHQEVSMPHFRTLRDMQLADREADIRGAVLYGVDDEKLGKIKDVIFDHSEGRIHYVVVDTGGWLHHREFLVPAERVHNYESDPNAFQVDMVKKHVERLPPFEESVLRSPGEWRDYEKHYDEWVKTGDVIHRKGSGNIVTPTPEEMPVEPSIGQGSGPTGQGRRLDLTPRRFASGEVSAPTYSIKPEESTNTSGAVLPTSSRSQRPIGSMPQPEEAAEIRAPSARWARFQRGLRRQCELTSGECPECGGRRRVA